MKTLIILPGWNSNKQLWHAFTKMAKDDFDVHVIELPCFGNEPCPNTVWGVEEYADFVKNKIASIDNKKESIVVLGHSFGGAVATQLIATNPHLADQLILVGAAIIRPKKSLKRTLFATIAKIGKLLLSFPLLKSLQPLAKKLLYKAADSPDYQETSGIMKQIYQKIIRQDLTPLLPTITTKTTIIWGKKDTYTPLHYGEKIHTLLEDSQMHIIEEGTHGLHHEPHLHEFYSLIKTSI